MLFFAKHSLDSISQEFVNRYVLNYVVVQVTANASLVGVKLVWAVNGNSDSYSCLCGHSLIWNSSRATELCWFTKET